MILSDLENYFPEFVHYFALLPAFCLISEVELRDKVFS